MAEIKKTFPLPFKRMEQGDPCDFCSLLYHQYYNSLLTAQPYSYFCLTMRRKMHLPASVFTGRISGVVEISVVNLYWESSDEAEVV